MDTKKTKALLLALERGSLTAAAEELGYTQSGLTHMMNSLEDEAGIKLLVRSKGGGQTLRYATQIWMMRPRPPWFPTGWA